MDIGRVIIIFARKPQLAYLNERRARGSTSTSARGLTGVTRSFGSMVAASEVSRCSTDSSTNIHEGVAVAEEAAEAAEEEEADDDEPAEDAEEEADDDEAEAEADADADSSAAGGGSDGSVSRKCSSR